MVQFSGFEEPRMQSASVVLVLMLSHNFICIYLSQLLAPGDVISRPIAEGRSASCISHNEI